ncbi:hypothetical protein PQO03_07035 [Lentisphaera profundi]|uniref:Glycoamylase-like domain-containing protein n=1 Tax=Lentisphaera profundi TaxID=1658616 RepID=A0ABY7VRI0_9BACT|nr:hypothetical protein [Lentisphaera profundi]WDE95471.1 hypothetical protein PQO03_07035 [Lentisphaera profundi]
MYRFKCEFCGSLLEHQRDISGMRIQCGNCDKKFNAVLYAVPDKLTCTEGGVKESFNSPRKTHKSRALKNKQFPVFIFLSVCVAICIALVMSFNNMSKDNGEVKELEIVTNEKMKHVRPPKYQDSKYQSYLKDACAFYGLLRAEKGLYLDLITIPQKEDYRVSTASTGIGLVALAISAELSFDNEVEPKIIETLETCLAKTSGIHLKRNKSGLFYHFIDARDGGRWGKSEFSTIDTALLVAGATFCRNQFPDNKKIQSLTQELWDSVNWELCRFDDHHYYLTQDEHGVGGAKTRLFNEYLLLADYVSFSLNEKETDMNQAWRKKFYKDHGVITDSPGHFLPLFTFQFPLYLSPYRVKDPVFIKESLQAMKVDRMWWYDQLSKKGLWGSSAGASIRGYGVDSTERNSDMVLCMPSVGGFIPFATQAELDFDILLNNKDLIYELNGLRIPWRASYRKTEWRARAIQGIDFSPLLFGLAGHESALGLEYFAQKSKLTYRR